jgi:hypothetical protein
VGKNRPTSDDFRQFPTVSDGNISNGAGFPDFRRFPTDPSETVGNGAVFSSDSDGQPTETVGNTLSLPREMTFYFLEKYEGLILTFLEVW